MTTKAFEMSWDSSAGAVQVRLPSGTRLNIGKEYPTFLWNFLDALTQLHERDEKYLLTPMTEKHFRYIFARWRANGNKALKDALEAMEPKERARLSEEQIEAMRQKFLSEGHVVIRPLQSPPKNLTLDDLLPIDLEGLE